jgi:hypothetical protein
MSDSIDIVLDTLFSATNAKHAELGLRPVSRKSFDQLRPIQTNPATPGFGGNGKEDL